MRAPQFSAFLVILHNRQNANSFNRILFEKFLYNSKFSNVVLVMVFIQNCITTNQSKMWEQTNNLYLCNFLNLLRLCLFCWPHKNWQILKPPIIMSPICLFCTIFKIKKVFPLFVCGCVCAPRTSVFSIIFIFAYIL